MNMRVPCQYAIVQFLPYPETGEFANVGVVLACPQMRYLGVRIAPHRRTKRVTDFFEGLQARVYREALRYIEGDLNRFSDAVAHGQIPANLAFDEITRPREALIRYGAARTIMSNGHPNDTLQQLYDRFVERDFATKEYHETAMRQRVDDLLANAHLRSYFAEAAVGDDSYPVKFPFVSIASEAPQIVIKPLNLTQDEPCKIFEHGNTWLGRVIRLRKHGQLPKTVLFAIDQAAEGEKRIKAAAEVTADLRSAGAIVEPLRHTDAILRVAKQAKP
ncbi:DUF3037 domain-containing protein [Xanthomonas vasicola pv. vasculorum]|uniref:DUF3037 domain-containing protein n=2 Tax=Xanthomonas vasicola TaxID=56459 RepID=A0ABD7SGU5_XANVA|nr:DUF3037 domain-containing protein [Xanthomonas vasicola]AZM72866.1 DUF3037 domain-containing protein [Xanthomonas vasicola pv. vasculorum]KGR39051.1 hypothetical protein NX05_19280 [Xanthomonas vasicola]KGR59342.1 hypothetical protein NX79_15270 [Xanthomonas vasicola]MDO6972912.1 DUF3037 domain-containing protein [Xanthomonas vasicola]MDO6986426.1 DUF3037 domain-containing protein [Xanthomonas vasicola]